MKRALAIALLFVTTTALAQDRSKGSLLFIVTDAQGKPIAGAEVGAWNDEDVWIGTTDERGLATLPDIFGGPVFAYASAERHVTASEDDIVVPAGEETTVRLSLSPGIPFDGQVVDHRGEPLPDIYVEVLPGGMYEGASLMVTDRTAYDFNWTDEQGRFHVRGIPPDGIATVVVEAEGWQTTRIGVKAFGDSVRPNPLVIRLARGAALTGTVTTPDGKPVAGATVLVVPADDEAMQENPGIVRSSNDGAFAEAVRAITGRDGAFVTGGLPVNQAFVAAAAAPGFARSAWSEPFSLTEHELTHAVALVLRVPAR